MKFLLTTSIIILNCFFIRANKVYEFNTTCQQAYLEIMHLRLDNGQALINKAKQQNPDNLIPVVLENYIDFFVLFFNEDPLEFKKRYPKFEERIKLLKQGSESSPFYTFCLSAVYLHKSAVNIKFDNKVRAALDFQTAYKYIKQNKKAYPTFTPNQLLYGSLQAVAGTIPKGYQWIAGLFGIKGSITNGINTVRHFANSSNDPWAKLMSNEAAFMYCYLMFYLENKKDESIQFIKDKKLDVVNNHLFAYMAANLSLNNKQVNDAEIIINNRNKSSEYFSTPVWDFLLGFIHLYRLQTQQAINDFESYLQAFKGNFYVKDIYQKISWCYYLQGNMTKAKEARKNCINKGATVTDADQQALREAKRGKWDNQILLKARILNDGGFNKDAINLLQGKSTSSFTDVGEQLEFNYRVGRINDDLQNYDDAIAFYIKAINIGETRTEYYAARAALQIAMIHEKRGDKKQAIKFYEKCIDMDNHDYKNSLDQRAKSGIARCTGN
ncbi:MAG: tetratricopeptide repeat protein [Chitinophagaceae bacterium]|nr:tetratricopeptide repeat protein [Chitinophagaceae bacterium]MCW5905589.1 tetratricopeptide repeat protein [Chitinophagaceae bacterium]